MTPVAQRACSSATPGDGCETGQCRTVRRRRDLSNHRRSSSPSASGWPGSGTAHASEYDPPCSRPTVSGCRSLFPTSPSSADSWGVLWSFRRLPGSSFEPRHQEATMAPTAALVGRVVVGRRFCHPASVSDRSAPKVCRRELETWYRPECDDRVGSSEVSRSSRPIMLPFAHTSMLTRTRWNGGRIRLVDVFIEGYVRPIQPVGNITDWDSRDR